MVQTREFKDIPVSSIVITKLQIRKFYNRERMRELTKSIREEGIMQGVVVRPFKNNKFELVFGSRRLKAARKIKQQNITALITNKIDDKDAIVMALNENLHRQDLEPFEEAKAILRLMKEFNMGVNDIARKIGRNHSFIKSRLKLLKMPKEIQKLIAEKTLPSGHVNLLANLSVSDQRQLAQEATKHNLSKRELQVHIQDITGAILNPRMKKEMAKWTPERLQLRVKDFTRFLKSIKPIVLEMGPMDILNVRLALEKLVEESDLLVKELKRFAKV